MLTPEEIEIARNTRYFGGEHWVNKGEPCCIASVAMHRGVKFKYSEKYGIVIADDYAIVHSAAVDLAIWLDCYVGKSIPSPILLCERLVKEKKKIFKRATY